MSEPLLLDPYAGNILCEQLGPIYSRQEALRLLTECPPRPSSVREIPRHIRMRLLMQLRDFHIPRDVEGRLFETTDVMVREAYRYQDPALPSTFAMLSGETMRRKRPGMPAFAAVAEGISGVGKTEATLRCMNCYPRQVITHATFPGLVGSHEQVVWLSIDVPPSGRAEDLARSLMTAWDVLLGNSRFKEILSKDRLRNSMQALDEWRQVARSHFLGILHLDEVQNFFRIGTLEQRRRRKVGEGPPELRVVEDQCLRWILTLLNTWGIPVLFSGTPDGIGALTKRFSTSQRFASGGYHCLQPYAAWSDPQYQTILLRMLGKYQYVEHPLAVDDQLAELVFNLSGGVPRIIIALWIAANRLALEESGDRMRLDHFAKAADTLLAPLGPAVAALRSQDPLRLVRYEDLVSCDPTFWPRFWESVERS